MGEALFTFIHVTDTHLCEKVDVITPFIGSVHAETHHPLPDFIVFGGDNINGRRNDGSFCRREMPMLKKRLEQLNVPYYIICDNHDTWGEEVRGTQYRDYFGNERLVYTAELGHGFTGIFMSARYIENSREICLEDNLDRLDTKLGKAKGTHVLLFSHTPMFPPRKPVPQSKRGQMKRDNWEASRFARTPEESKPIRDVIAGHGNVLVYYSGHCHVHSHVESNGTHYTSTGALCSEPWEYRYVQVFADRIEHSCVAPLVLKDFEDSREDENIMFANFWAGCVDDDHATVELYHGGLPDERKFIVYYE